MMFEAEIGINTEPLKTEAVTIDKLYYHCSNFKTG